MPVTTKYFTYMNDRIAKKLFTNSLTGKRYAAALISEILKIDEMELLKHLEWLNPYVSINTSLVDSELDSGFTNGKVIFNIEINKSKGGITNDKNNSYICQLVLGQLPNSKYYQKLMPITQINIDAYDYFNEDRFIYHSMMLETTSLKPENKKIQIYHINISKLYKEEYQDICKNRLKKILYIFACKDEKTLDKLYKGDELMESVKEFAKRLSENIDWTKLYYNQDEIDRLNREEAIEEGREQGIEQGIEQNLFYIVSELLKDNVDDKLIMKYTHVSKTKLEEIKKSILIKKEINNKSANK